VRGHASKQERAAARNILRNYLRVKPGENVLIEVWEHNLPFGLAFVSESCRIGAHPFVQFQDRDTFWSELERGKLDYFGTSAAIERAALRAADVHVYLMGPEDLDAAFEYASKIPRFWERFMAYQDPYYRIARAAGVRGSRLSVAYAWAPDARRWGVDLVAWHRELMAAYLVDPRPMLRVGHRLASVLRRGRRVELHHRNGTRLAFRTGLASPSIFTGVHSRKHRAGPGRGYGDPSILNDLPWGAVSVPLLPTSAQGTFIANRPSYYPSGRTEGARWLFQDGRLIRSRFRLGGRIFKERTKDTGDDGRLAGSLIIGLNPAIRHAPNIQFAERGAISVQLGPMFLSADYPSSRYPKATVAGATLSVQGRVVIREGRIL
jgi:leucyl aminopeptidase (aminopeptidase T)